MVSERFLGRDRGKLKTGRTSWDCRESCPRSGDCGAGQGRAQQGEGEGSAGCQPEQVGDGDTTEGHALLLWDLPRGARCAEVRRDKFRRGGTRGRTLFFQVH